MSLLVFVRFAFFGVSVKCAEAGFLQVMFITFLIVAVVLEWILLFWVFETYHLAGMNTCGNILAAWGYLRGPWEQQEGHLGVQNHICFDFVKFSGPHVESFWDSYGLKFYVAVLPCFQVIFCIDF